jgi:hypothetical protein
LGELADRLGDPPKVTDSSSCPDSPDITISRLTDTTTLSELSSSYTSVYNG